MKILHTADWHLGKKLERYARLPEQELVMNEICEIAEKQKVDAVLIAGDIFDTFNPSIDALELFYKTVKRLSRNASVPVIAIAGNHDSPDRIEAPDPLARENGIFLIGYPNSKLNLINLDSGLKITNSDMGFVEFQLVNSTKPLRIISSPYANEQRLKTALNLEKSEVELREILENNWGDIANKYCDNQGVNILLSHHFFVKEGDKAIEDSDDEKPILYVGGTHELFTNAIPDSIHYTALGHLHRYQEVKGANAPVVYSGSPIAYSFAEANQEKHIAILNFDKNNALNIEKHSLTQGKKLIRQKFEDIDKAVVWLLENQDILVELTIVAEKYLLAEDRQRLYQAHDGIISIIPEIKGTNNTEKNDSEIDLEQSITSLFKQYFKEKNGQEPNQDIVNLFNEIQSDN